MIPIPVGAKPSFVILGLSKELKLTEIYVPWTQPWTSDIQALAYLWGFMDDTNNRLFF